LILHSRLKNILDEKGLSVRQVAREIDYRPESVRQLYNDQMERFPRDLLTRLCYYLNLTPNDLLYIDKTNPTPKE
jgi:DNA-binding Xre family transcriptional regulator